MDIARPDLKRRRLRRRILWVSGTLVVLASVTIGLSRLEPAAPTVDRSTVWTGEVKRGEMLRQVRGNGSLVPERIVFVQSETEGRIDRILVLPGAAVTPETVLMELSNPELKQAVFDLEWQVKASNAGMRKLEVQLQSERLGHEAQIASLKAEFTQAELEAEADDVLADGGLVPELTRKRSRAKANELKGRLEVERKRLEIGVESDAAQIAVQKADAAKLQALLELKRNQVGALVVRAGIEGVVQAIGDQNRLQVGQRVSAAATLAKIVQPRKLKAEIKIAETQARDVQIGQSAEIDTRNGVVAGRVTRVDPAVQNGTVTVDVALEGALPKARPDLSVDGTIELERLVDILFVGRPVHGQADSTIGLFKVDSTGSARRVLVELGRSSVSTIEVVAGLDVGDEVVLSDMSQWDEYDVARLR